MSFGEIVDPVIDAVPELARLIPRFEFLLDDIGRATDEQIRARALNAFGVLALLFLRDARTPERFLSAVVRWADLTQELAHAPDGRRALMVLLRYVAMVLDKSARPSFRRIALTARPRTEEKLMTTIAEDWQEEGQRALLIKQLQTKFGKVDEQALSRLDAADGSVLMRYAQRILTATTLDEVFAAES